MFLFCFIVCKEKLGRITLAWRPSLSHTVIFKACTNFNSFWFEQNQLMVKNECFCVEINYCRNIFLILYADNIFLILYYRQQLRIRLGESASILDSNFLPRVTKDMLFKQELHRYQYIKQQYINILIHQHDKKCWPFVVQLQILIVSTFF